LYYPFKKPLNWAVRTVRTDAFLQNFAKSGLSSCIFNQPPVFGKQTKADTIIYSANCKSRKKTEQIRDNSRQF